MKTNSIKFYWNGIKVNGELVKCTYCRSTENGPITIYGKQYDHLPGDVLPVTNGSDIYTDYFEDDEATITPEHPLYKFAEYAWAKEQSHDLQRRIKYLEGRIANPRYSHYVCYYKDELAKAESQLADLPKVKNPGHPAAADLAKIEALNLAAEAARVEAERELEFQRREKMLSAKSSGYDFISEKMLQFPLLDGEPAVTIEWSEDPHFYAYEDGELVLSVSAAEAVLLHFDELRHLENVREGHGGYSKTSFVIRWADGTEEGNRYEGRYDLGDNDGGMIAHIRSFGFSTGNKEILAFADLLDSYNRYTPQPEQQVSVAPWFEAWLKNRNQ